MAKPHRFSDPQPFAAFVEGECVALGGKRDCHRVRKAAKAAGKAAHVALNLHRPGFALGDNWSNANAD